MQFPRVPHLTRRQFLKVAGGLAALGVGACDYAWLVEPHLVEVTVKDLPIAHLPSKLVGRTLVQISDLHVGPVVDSKYIASSMETIRALSPDLVVVTGDFINQDGEKWIDEVARLLVPLARTPLGCFGVLGNHDYGLGWSNPRIADKLTARLNGIGLQVLRNSSRVAGGLQIVGLDDLWGPRFHPEEVLPNLSRELPSLVLCHNPDAVDLPVWSGYQGWVLSGHTHGGQLKPPFLPPPFLPVKNRRYTAGAFDLWDGRNLYINRGLGYLVRARLKVRPEITVFHLKTA